jgi:tetratricopeptide (TPR) repeat protein
MSYRSIADVYRLNGDNEQAIKYYTRSLELNTDPLYTKAISEILKTLTKKDN